MTARLPDDALQAIQSLIERIDGYYRPPPLLTVTEWAERYRILSRKDSAEPGPYRALRTPYAREPQDALSAHSGVSEVVLMWGAQLGKSTILNNWLCYQIDTQPGPIMIVQPTTDTAKGYSRQRITPMLLESPRLAGKIAENKSRDESNTMLLKEFPGGYLVITGANSAAGLRSRPIRDIAFDEVDAYPLDVDGEGDPIRLAEARQSTFARRKRAKTSTPTRKGFSRIEQAYQSSDRRRFHVPCPHCDGMQWLEWGADREYGLKWALDDAGNPRPETAHYVCKHCAAVIEEREKSRMLSAGVWVAENPGAAVRGYHLSTLYSPLGWFSWRELVQEWVDARKAEAQGDATLMRAFRNTRLAETYEDDGDKVTTHELAARLEDYPLGVAPLGVLMLVQGVDVQRDRIERRVWGFGRGQESWLVDVEVIHGDPLISEGQPGSPWTTLTERIRTPVTHASGRHIRIEATAVDSGDGTSTQAVYAYARAHGTERVIAIKGMSGEKRPPLGKPSAVDVAMHGKTIARGLKLWPIGVDHIKHLFYGRLRLKARGPGYIHLPAELAQTTELEQITSETLVTRYIKGRPRLEWHKARGARNEGLDCAVYSIAAAHFVNLHRMRDSDWDRRERLLITDLPKTEDDDHEASQAPAPAAPAATTARDNRPGTARAPRGPARGGTGGGFGRAW